MLTPDERRELDDLRAEVHVLKAAVAQLAQQAASGGLNAALSPDLQIVAATLRGAFHTDGAILNLLAQHAVFRADTGKSGDAIDAALQEIVANINRYITNLKRFPLPPGGRMVEWSHHE